MAAVMERILPRVRVGEVAVLRRYVNWPVICVDINRALGVDPRSRVRISMLLNVAPSTVQSWMEDVETKSGSDVGYAYGEALLELHRRVCGPEETLRRLKEFRERATKAAS